VKDAGRPYALQLLTEANDAALSLWRSLDRDANDIEAESWFQKAINHPAGTIAEFWVYGLSLWLQQQRPRPNALCDGYSTALTEAVKDTAIVGRLARSVLVSQFAFLLGADSAWTTEYLVPLFSGDRGTAEFQAAWDGFLFGRLNPATAECLDEAFLVAAKRLETDLSGCRDRFVGMYLAFLVHYANDVITKWIPPLLGGAGEETRRHFAWVIESSLRGMDSSAQEEWWRRWLREYWANRVQGIPVPLATYEVESILGWLPHLSSLFPEAVEIAVRMPVVEMKHTSLIRELTESDLPKRYPHAVAKLIIYLGEAKTPSYIWHRADTLMSMLVRAGLPRELEQGLRELAVRMGFDIKPS
jgi:hypothetical protein